MGTDYPHGTPDRSGHLQCEKRARGVSESLFSTAAKPGVSLKL